MKSTTPIPFLLTLALAVAPAQAQRSPAEAKHGMVSSVHELASQAGVEILQRGGNAIDAAVATGLALAVVYPFAGNLGGGGFMIIHLANGTSTVIDYRETAPAAAMRDMYVNHDGKLIAGLGSSTVGWKASGVPGTIAGFALAVKKYGSGKVTWAEIIEPARRLAANGHLVTAASAKSLRQWEQLLAPFDETKRIYLHGGAYWNAGDNWVQVELADTFARLQKYGPSEFYEGETARLIAKAMGEHGGDITLEDLKNYRPIERAPLHGNYRGYDIVTMPPPSSGGIALLQMLAMIEPFEVTAMGATSAEKYHLFTEAMKRAFRDRAEYVGDPSFVKVPVEQLLAPAYLKSRMADFSPTKATPAAAVQPGLGKFIAAPQREKMETTHFSVVDAAGNAVSNTYTLNGAYGSAVTIAGTGILMNNEMDDFTSLVGAPNMFGLIQGEANAIVPGKRPLSSMTPTMVFKDGKLVLVTGSPGGPTIINTVFEVISNVIDFNLPLSQAVEASRIHHQWMPDILTYEKNGLSVDTAALLKAKGHVLKERQSYEGAYQGDAETVGRDAKTGVLLGAADPRKPDSKAMGF